MNGKSWFRSKGVIGALVVIVSMIASFWGWSVDADKTTEIIIQAAALVGGVMALWGRIKADRPIRFTRTKPGGKFNPDAEVRKATRNDKGHAYLRPLLVLLFCYGIYFTAWAGHKWEVSRYAELRLPTKNVSLVVVPIQDNRPFIVRLLSSLRLVPAFAVVDGKTQLTQLEIRGGAEL